MKLILSILSHHIKSSIELNFSEKQQQPQSQSQHTIHRFSNDKIISVKSISHTDTDTDRNKIHTEYNKLRVNLANRALVHRSELKFQSTTRDQNKRSGHRHCHQTHYTATKQRHTYNTPTRPNSY